MQVVLERRALSSLCSYIGRGGVCGGVGGGGGSVCVCVHVRACVCVCVCV